jgi:hypothetical protein
VLPGENDQGRERTTASGGRAKSRARPREIGLADGVGEGSGMGRGTYGRRPDAERRRQARELRAQGLTYREIGLQLGITHQGARHLVLAAAGERRAGPPRCESCAGLLPKGSRGGRCPACVAADPDAPFGERLWAARVTAGLTQQQLADLVGVSAGRIHEYERRQARPRPGNGAALARVLGPRVLVGSEGEKAGGEDGMSPELPP